MVTESHEPPSILFQRPFGSHTFGVEMVPEPRPLRVFGKALYFRVFRGVQHVQRGALILKRDAIQRADMPLMICTMQDLIYIYTHSEIIDT